MQSRIGEAVQTRIGGGAASYSTAWQAAVPAAPASAVAGDFCSGNPRVFVVAGPGGWRAGNGLIAGPNGVLIGRFCWADDSIVDLDTDAPIVVVNHGAGRPLGLVHANSKG